MLQMMRNLKSSFLLKILLVIIAVAFVLGGYISLDDNSSNIIARVNDIDITLREYKVVYDNMFSSYRDRFNGNVPDFLKTRLKDDALDQLINNKLIIKEIEKEGLSVSNNEIWDEIKKRTKLQNDGKFDQNSYLKNSKKRRHNYETSLKREILFNNMLSIIKNSIKLTDDEIKDEYIKENEQVEVEYMLMKPENFTEQVEATEDKLKEYFKENEENYKTDRKVKVEYAYAGYKDFLDNVTVLDEDISEYYSEHSDDYFEDEKVRASHILLKSKGSGTDENPEDEKLKKKAEDLLVKIREGADFAELSKKHSEDSTASNGGDLGFFPKGRMVSEFEQAAFALKKGEVSDVVKTSFGYHIIKITDIKEQGTKTFDEVKGEITEKLKKKEALVLVRLALKKLVKGLDTRFGSDLKKGAETLKLKFSTTDFFTNDDKTTKVLSTTAFNSEANTLKKGELGSIIKGFDEFFVIRSLDVKEPKIAEFKDVKDNIEIDFKKQDSKRLVKENSKTSFDKLTAGADIKKLVKELSLRIEKTGFIKRSSSIPEIGRDEEFIKKAFSSDKEKYELVESGDRYYIIKVLSKKGIDQKKFTQDKKSFKGNLLKNKENIALMMWIDTLKKNAKIEKFTEFL